MSGGLKSRVQVFDPEQEYSIIERRLPHWSQAGTICFITWRTWDSMPRRVVELWKQERAEWLTRHGIDPAVAEIPERLAKLDLKLLHQFRSFISQRWNDHLDECHGECVLRRAEIAQEITQSLTHFDGDRYDLTDFVVMPNHVHVLAAFLDEEAMLAQCESWKHFTARKINRLLRRNDRFWQQDGFDHLVRSVEQFMHYRRYIAENPSRAHLKVGEFVHFSKPI
jgi:putative transposase